MKLFAFAARRRRTGALRGGFADTTMFSDADLADMGVKRYQLEEALAR